MFHQLVSHNDDIRKLVEKGYAVSFDSNYLVIRDIPYLAENLHLQIGAILSKLIFIDKTHIQIDDHQILFCGSHPCQLDGKPIANLGGSTVTLQLSSPDLIVQRSFSNKPVNGFSGLFDKIESYVTIISGPAIELYGISPLTFHFTEEVTDPIFKFRDTLTSRAEIGDLAQKFKDDIIAVIGLGGTGSYLLDFLVKTPVKEIRAFDLDLFYVHNAFRSPGKLEEDELGKPKAAVYQKRYEGFRTGLKIHPKYILADSKNDLESVTFAFVCVDKGSSRKDIFEVLLNMQIPFIDVGMGLNRGNGPISGMLRATYYDTQSGQQMMEKKLAPLTDESDDVYVNNIQISELNALNACLAITKYKQLRGFYVDANKFHHMLLSLNDFHLGGE